MPPAPDVFARTTHLGIGAHQDDLEFMALHGILECYGRDDQWFGGVVATDGAGSARAGRYAGYSDAQIAAERVKEQAEAARIGEYGFVEQLGLASAQVRDPHAPALVDALVPILEQCRAAVVYAHNPADRHPTHIAVFAATLAALRRLPEADRPTRFIGCEVWRGLDWLPDPYRVEMDVSAHPDLARDICGVFRSQIEGGKRYDEAVAGRRRANATFSDSHAVDAASGVIIGMDLMPLLEDPDLQPSAYVAGMLAGFGDTVAGLLQAWE